MNGFLPSISKTDLKDLNELGNRHRNSNGVLLTPPIGKINSKTKFAKEYIENMVERLAGERLRKENKFVIVNIYSGNQLNAFASKINKKENSISYRFLKTKHKEKELYEIGINAGTFRELEHEEELAAIVAHELSHIFEKHVDKQIKKDDIEKRAEEWLSKQAKETVADNLAIEMMVHAGYDPEGALSALNKVFKRHNNKNTGSNDFVAIQSAASSHHHEGVRIGFDQAEIEKLRRTETNAWPLKKFKKSPQSLFLTCSPRKFSKCDEMEEIKKLYEDLIDHFLKHSSCFATHYDGCKTGKEILKTAVNYTKAYNFTSPEQRRELFMHCCRKLNITQASPKDKVNVLLTLMLVEGYYKIPLNDEDVWELNKFFLQNTIKGNWTAKKFLPKAKQENFCFGSMMSNTGFANVFSSLYSMHPEWAKLVNALPESLAETNYYNILGARLTNFIESNLKKSGTLEPIHKKNILKYLKNIDVNGLPKDNYKDYFDALKSIYELECSDETFKDEIKKAIKPLLDIASSLREKQMLLILKGPEYPRNLLKLLADGAYYHEATLFPFTDEFKKKLGSSLATLAVIANKNTFTYNEAQYALTSSLKGILADFLHDPSLPEESKEAVFNFIAKNTRPSCVDSSNTREKLPKYVAGFSREKILDLIQKNNYEKYRPIIERAAGTLLGTKRPVSAPEENLKVLCDEKKTKFSHIKESIPKEKLSKTHYEAITDIRFAMDQEWNFHSSILTFIGSDKKVSEEVSKKFSFKDLETILSAYNSLYDRLNYLHLLGYDERLLFEHSWDDPRPQEIDHLLDFNGALFIMDIFINSQNKVEPEKWYRTLNEILSWNKHACDARFDYKEKLEGYLLPYLEQLPNDKIYEWLKKKHILDILQPETIGKLLCKVTSFKGSTSQLAQEVKNIDNELKLKENYPEAYEIFKEELAEAAKLQPADLDLVLPPDTRTVSEKANILSAPIRGLSALVAVARQQPVKDQIHLIEYLMGRNPDIPQFITNPTISIGYNNVNIENTIPLIEIVRAARAKLQKESAITRVLVANSFLAGPSSFVYDPKGLDELLNHMLKDVRPEHKDLAEKLAKALLDSQGSTDSLALAYVLGQKNKSSTGKMSEAAILNNLFDAYGVPGIKLKQYLAFTNEFSEFREAFEESQDSAMPLSYYETLRLINDRFNGNWPKDLHVDKILGSGSVNIAVRYFNPASKSNEVLVIARKDIEKSTQYDFLRIKRFFDSLIKTPQDKKRYGYLTGLMDIIHDSVKLEFNKKGVLSTQKSMYPLYNCKVNGWKIRSIDAFKEENMAIFMEEAKGKTARKVLSEDPEIYKSAMQALSQVEFDLLLGINPNNNWSPSLLYANPDFHDGQILIDTSNRTITILDFGQAVPISNEEREYAIDVLRVITKAENAHISYGLLKKHCPNLTHKELDVILEKKERMDIFVHLISLLNRKGSPPPISVVHWIMAINRQVALGEKADIPTDNMIRNLLLAYHLHAGLKSYNALHLLKRWLFS